MASSETLLRARRKLDNLQRAMRNTQWELLLPRLILKFSPILISHFLRRTPLDILTWLRELNAIDHQETLRYAYVYARYL
jgi:hypothetical protein